MQTQYKLGEEVIYNKMKWRIVEIYGEKVYLKNGFGGSLITTIKQIKKLK